MSHTQRSPFSFATLLTDFCCLPRFSVVFCQQAHLLAPGKMPGVKPHLLRVSRTYSEPWYGRHNFTS